MTRALRSADPHHIGYTRVKSGKLERIPQKGALLKERGKFKPKEGSKEAKDILGIDYKNFTKDLHAYFSNKETMSKLKVQMETLASKNEETMGKIRPLLTKFDNVSKEENKFITEFMSDGFKHKFQSYSRETLPYKDLFEESFKRLTSEYQNEINKLKETLKKVTAMESFKRELQKSDSMSKIADYMKNIIRIKEDMVRNMKKMDAIINRVQKALFVFIDKPENRIFNLQKSRVKAHPSKTKSGKLYMVREYSKAATPGKFVKNYKFLYPIDLDNGDQREVAILNYSILPASMGGRYEPPENAQLEDLKVVWADTGKELSNKEWDKHIDKNWDTIESRVIEYALDNEEAERDAYFDRKRKEGFSIS